MYPQVRHLPPVRSDAAAMIERSEALQQIARTGQHRCRRWIEPAKLVGIACTPVRKLKCERNEIGGDDFGRRERCKTSMRALAPSPVAHACFEAPRPALSLVR